MGLPSLRVDPDVFVDVEYAVFQPERGANGTPHLQGYLRFTKRKTRAKVSSYFYPEKPHLEVAKGTPAQNREYCTKEDTREPNREIWEYGVCPRSNQGDRSDIHSLRDAVTSGRTFLDLVGDDSLLPVVARHMPFTNRLLQEAALPIYRPDVHVTFCYGPSGTGKSTCAGVFDPEPRAYLYDANGSGRFWDGYNDQKRLILDEFSGAVLTPTIFNRICDKGPVKVDVKNGSHYLAATDIRITANYRPDSWWREGTRYNREALARRIHECHHHGKIGQCEIFHSDDDGYALVKMENWLDERGIN